MGDINSPSENSEFVLCLLYFVVLLFLLFFFLSLSLSLLSLCSLSLSPLSLLYLSLSLLSLSLPISPSPTIQSHTEGEPTAQPPKSRVFSKFGFRFSKNVLFIHLILFIATAVAGEDERKKMHSKMFAYQWLIKDAHKNGQFHTRGRERE